MRIAITGAFGYIGSHILDNLLNNGHDVVCIVRNATSNDKRNDCRCDFIDVSIGKESDNLFQDLGEPDVLLDLAWSNLGNYMSLDHIGLDLPIHYAFIRKLVKSGLKSVIVTGTCFEYGIQNGQLSEEMRTNPVNPYGYAKDALRKQLEFLKNEADFSLTWLRIFYIFGNVKGNDLYSQLFRSIEQKHEKFNMSNGEQIRDYMSIELLSEVISEITIRNQDYGIINICSGKPISVRALVEHWRSDLGSNIELNLGFYEYPDYEPLCFWGDNSKLKSILNDL
jgi:nucleoside-diphosphate-sugar epimerase